MTTAQLARVFNLQAKLLSLAPAFEKVDRMIDAATTPTSTAWTRLAHTPRRCSCRCHHESQS